MDPFIGEIRIFAGNYPPYGWAFCNGDILQIQQNTALYSLLGTTYGGDGKTTFALPDLRAKAPLHKGQGQGLSNRTQGKTYGVNQVVLTGSEMPVHNHLPNCKTAPSQTSPDNAIWSNMGRGAPAVYAGTPNVPMNAQAVGFTGSGNAHNNMQPYLGLSFIIALQGIFPPRS